MAYKNKTTFLSLKSILLLVTVAAILVVLPASVTADGGGTTPTLAVPLAKEVNTGSLDPTEQHWYKFTPEGAEVQQSLTLVMTPDDDGNTIKFILLNVFEESQIEFFSEGDASNMATFGIGEVVTQDDDPETGERSWTDTVSEPTTYYIQILNDSDFSVDYKLFSTSISPEPVEEPEPPAEVVEPETAVEAEVEAAAPEPIPALNNDPGSAETLPSGKVQGRVAPNSTYWYSFTVPNLGADRFEDRNYTMFFTPDDGNRRHYVNFELYPYSEFQIWQRGEGDQLNNLGAGMLVSRDNDYNTGERMWTGWLNKGDQYLLSISNGTDIPIDYWLYDGNIINPILGPEPVPAAAKVFAPGASPQTAKSLEFGVNRGGLDPGEEAWYSFRITDFDDQAFEEMALTMIATPDDGNRIRRMTFDVFTAGGVQNWSPGDNTQISNLGAGSVVYRDDNHLTGERFWQGWVVDNDLYLVQIRNGTDVHMDYHLFTGDVYRPELGPKRPPVARVAAAPGKAPGSAEALKVDINDGKLKPGEEQWYTFSRGDVDATGQVETVFTLIFTPDDGNRVRSVNFELFEGDQLRDWSPDNRFNIVSFGRGSVVSRDGGLETGELLWKGHVMARDIYYMRVSNESDVTIDYQIFPDDVISTNLTRAF